MTVSYHRELSAARIDAKPYNICPGLPFLIAAFQSQVRMSGADVTGTRTLNFKTKKPKNKKQNPGFSCRGTSVGNIFRVML